MFDISEKRLAWIPVDFTMLKSDGDDLAVPVTYTIELQVDLVDKDEFKKIWVMPDPEDEPEAFVEFTKMGELGRFKMLVHNWRGVVSGGRSVPFTDENIERMIAVPMFTQGFNIAYPNAWSGRAETRAKNSEDSPANGAATVESK